MPSVAPLRAAATRSAALVARQPNVRYPLSFRAFSTTRQVRGGGSHESHYDPPGGWLFGIKPGEKYEKEGWEGVWFFGVLGSIAFVTIAYAFKPDTSIQTWALEEARRRLEAEGILEDPTKPKE